MFVAIHSLKPNGIVGVAPIVLSVDYSSHYNANDDLVESRRFNVSGTNPIYWTDCWPDSFNTGSCSGIIYTNVGFVNIGNYGSNDTLTHTTTFCNSFGSVACTYSYMS